MPSHGRNRGSNPLGAARLRSYELRPAQPIKYVRNIKKFEKQIEKPDPVNPKAKTDQAYDNMYYVYLIKSISLPNKYYDGYTTNIQQSFDDHNAGRSFHTAKIRPWELVSYA